MPNDLRNDKGNRKFAGWLRAIANVPIPAGFPASLLQATKHHHRSSPQAMLAMHGLFLPLIRARIEAFVCDRMLQTALALKARLSIVQRL